MLQNIPRSRIVIYILILGLLPFVVAWMNFSNKRGTIQNLIDRAELIKEQAFIREKRQAVNIAVQEHYKNSDRYYIDKYIEALRFLKPEIQSLETLITNKNFAGDETVKQRLEFLTGEGNTLLFSEGRVETHPFFQETLATQVHPVEVNVEDLREILAHTEGVQIGQFKPAPDRPQLIFLDFKIDKKEVYANNEVFVLNTKLLKREYAP